MLRSVRSALLEWFVHHLRAGKEGTGCEELDDNVLRALNRCCWRRDLGIQTWTIYLESAFCCWSSRGRLTFSAMGVPFRRLLFGVVPSPLTFFALILEAFNYHWRYGQQGKCQGIIDVIEEGGRCIEEAATRIELQGNHYPPERHWQNRIHV